MVLSGDPGYSGCGSTQDANDSSEQPSMGADLMPTYPFGCEICGNKEDVVRKMDQRDDPLQCGACGHMMKRMIAAGLPFTMWGGRWRDQWRDKEGHDDGLGPYAE